MEAAGSILGTCRYVATMLPCMAGALTNRDSCPAQVQDVGFISLCAMATSIAHLSTAKGFLKP